MPEASSVADAREILQDGDWELLLLDRHLPDGDGIELCHEVREKNPHGYILLLTSTRFEQARRYGRPLSLAMIDIDHFKSINDQYGEEFVVILPETPLLEALQLAEKICGTDTPVCAGTDKSVCATTSGRARGAPMHGEP